MNLYWSKYVQKSEELYLSRALKFHKGNIDKWADAMRLCDGMKILEVGCAGGLLCHRIKEYLPNASITGIVEKAHFMAPDALTQSEYQTLLDMINRRYDAQIERYKSGEKNWEYRIVTTVLISGTK